MAAMSILGENLSLQHSDMTQKKENRGPESMRTPEREMVRVPWARLRFAAVQNVGRLRGLEHPISLQSK
jgi:hypothetical protein